MSFTQKIRLETRICTDVQLCTPSDGAVSWRTANLQICLPGQQKQPNIINGEADDAFYPRRFSE